ncbi:MAG TPA: hypothetical protein VG844_10070 [Terracidiphilus sp.]|jgi:hypothetical protein|nr:hypothetical protein [Terracidiphilus sp.]
MLTRFVTRAAFSAALLLAAASLAAQTPGKAPSSSDYDVILATAANRYYSAVRSGPAHGILESFQCSVQPEWPTLLAAMDKATGRSASGSVAPNDPRLALLTPVTITVTAEINGRSTLNWNQPAESAQPLDENATGTLDLAHQTVQHALEGFFQFWTPFINGTIVPRTSKGIEVHHTAQGLTLHAELRDQNLNEIFSPDFILREFNVSMSGVHIRFNPTFENTREGLLVKTFDSHIQMPGTPPPAERGMQVALKYRVVRGFQLPSHLSIDVDRTGHAGFIFSGCTVQTTGQ